MPLTRYTDRLADQLHQRVTGRYRVRFGARVPGFASVVQFSSGYPGQSHMRSFGTPYRAIAIPHANGGALKRLPSRDYGSSDCKDCDHCSVDAHQLTGKRRNQRTCFIVIGLKPAVIVFGMQNHWHRLWMYRCNNGIRLTCQNCKYVALGRWSPNSCKRCDMCTCNLEPAFIAPGIRLGLCKARKRYQASLRWL